MIELRTRLFVSLLVLLAAAPEASPQTASEQSAGESSGRPQNRQIGKQQKFAGSGTPWEVSPGSASNLESAGNVSLPGNPMDLPLGTRVLARPAQPIHSGDASYRARSKRTRSSALEY